MAKNVIYTIDFLCQIENFYLTYNSSLEFQDFFKISQIPGFSRIPGFLATL